MYGRRRYRVRIPRPIYRHTEQNVIPFDGSTTYDFSTNVNASCRYQHDIQLWSYGIPAMLKNCQLTWSTDGTIYWALIVFQQNYGTMNPLRALTSAPQLYEPQENVIASGILDPNEGERREFIRCARKMNPGNTLRLIVASASSGTTVTGLAKFYNKF